MAPRSSVKKRLVKKKSDKKKMDKKKLAHFRALLENLKMSFLHDLTNMAHNPESGEGSRDVSGHVMHMADVATDMYDREFNLELASKDRNLLQKIDEALRRIENGTYGFCLGTGKPIALARLEAIPYAEYCLEYQEELEKEQGRPR